MTDRALCITWYDLADVDRDAYVTWLHRVYLPALQASGIAWCAHYERVADRQRPTTARENRLTRTQDPGVPTGARYVLICGAAETDDLLAARQSAKVGVDADRMLAMRHGERTNIMVEAGRVEGPESRRSPAGGPTGPCIQLGNFNSASWQDEEDILRWYASWRMPAMKTLPGCIRVRRLASVAGWGKHGVLYEFTSLDERNRHFLGHEDAHPDMKALSDRMVGKLVHAPGSSTLALRLWPPIP